MRPVINRAGHDFETAALVICTDYSDDEAWRAVVALLDQSTASSKSATIWWTTVPMRERARTKWPSPPWPPTRDSKWCSWPTPPR